MKTAIVYSCLRSIRKEWEAIVMQVSPGGEGEGRYEGEGAEGAEGCSHSHVRDCESGRVVRGHSRRLEEEPQHLAAHVFARRFLVIDDPRGCC